MAAPRTSYVSPRSPDISPRTDDSGKSSPRTPPPVAPKPRKNKHIEEHATEVDTKGQAPNDPGPIETEIFVSISGPKSEHIPSQLTGPSILPGSVTYDYVSTKDKVDLVPGKVDVVESTESLAVTENKLEQEHIAPQHEPVHIDIVQGTSESKDDATSTICLDSLDISKKATLEKEHSSKENEPTANVSHHEQKSNSISEEGFHFRALEHIDDFVESVDTQKPRSQSVSSESSYTEFNECNVEEESNLEEIVEENDAENSALRLEHTNENKLSEMDSKDDNSAIEGKDESSEQNLKVYRSMAENIVADVISSVKGMNLSEAHTEKLPEVENNDELGTKTADSSEFPINEDDQPPPLPDNDAPPLPMSPCPVTKTISSEDTTFSYSAPPSQNIVEDVIENSQTAQVHAQAPVIVVSSVNNIDVDDENVVHVENGIYSQDILAPDLEEQGEYTDDFENDSSENEETREPEVVQTETLTNVSCDKTVADENLDDQSVNDVISLYADIEKSIVHDTDTNQNKVTNTTNEISTIESQRLVGELQLLDNKDLISDETESVDTKSLTSSEDMLSEGDIVESYTDKVHTENLEAVVPVLQTETETTNIDDHTQSKKVNGYSVSVKTNLERSEDLKVDTNSDKADSSFSSDSAVSPPRSGTPHSDSDRGVEKGLHSPEVDRMIRCKCLFNCQHFCHSKKEVAVDSQLSPAKVLLLTASHQ